MTTPTKPFPVHPERFTKHCARCGHLLPKGRKRFCQYPQTAHTRLRPRRKRGQEAGT